jgi:hypothetical protein
MKGKKCVNEGERKGGMKRERARMNVTGKVMRVKQNLKKNGRGTEGREAEGKEALCQAKLESVQRLMCMNKDIKRNKAHSDLCQIQRYHYYKRDPVTDLATSRGPRAARAPASKEIKLNPFQDF